MAIREKVTLKEWFRRGKYPTEEQFGDWMDSYVHKDEDKIPPSQVEGLAEELNGKYDRRLGENLASKHEELAGAVAAHVEESEGRFRKVNEDVDALEATSAEHGERIDALYDGAVITITDEELRRVLV